MITADISEFHFTYEDEGDQGDMNIITLEVMSDSSNADPIIENYDKETAAQTYNHIESFNKDLRAGVHFLTEKMQELDTKVEYGKEEGTSKGRTDLLEYMMRNDGSVICKMCGEILQSRTHWYRHKYKLHVAQPLNPAPLFQCEQCLVYFKSRKGYIGHLASRHSELLSDSSPVLTNAQLENNSKDLIHDSQEFKEDPELVIPKTSVPNYQTSIIKNVSKSTEAKKPCKAKVEQLPEPDWQERRSREEKLVADIIDRVRRECEAQQGSGVGGGPARRGYTRRTTVMNT